MTAVSAAVLVLAAGCAGEAGSAGAQGPKGDTGAQGAQGSQGQKGDPGDPGQKGDPGDKGDKGDKGDTGAAGQDATAFGTLAGTVKDYYGNFVAGATVNATVGKDAMKATADATGAYTLPLPSGTRAITVKATGYIAYTQNVEIVPAASTTFDVKLNPSGPVAVTAARTDTKSPLLPGDQISLSAQALIFSPALNGQTPTYKWTIVRGPAGAAFDSDTSATPKLTLANTVAFKKYLIENYATPQYKVNGDEELISIDRYQIVPLSYEQVNSQGNTTVVKVEVTIGGQKYTQTVNVAAKLPAFPTSGINNVPLNQPLILQGQFPFKKADGSYLFTPKATWNWTVTDPNNAAVTVSDATTAYPHFTPTVAGSYKVSEGGTERFQIIANNYSGMMTAAGTVDSNCTGCHATGSVAKDMFTPWMKTGHRTVIYAGIAEPLPDGHYAGTCTPCHTVGQGATNTNGYADKAAAASVDYSTLQGDINAEGDFWRHYPEPAKLAGIQCENCHGPQGAVAGPAHKSTHNTATTEADKDKGVKSVASRMSYSSNVCATCHARAPKHGRFTQWILSSHSNFSTVTYNANSTTGKLSNSCACCHSAQGFKAYRKALITANGDRSKTTLPDDLTLANAEPITCVTCHDSHDEGEESKVEWQNLSSVGPTEGSTYMLPSGFAATGIGKGALCITCHNSRQGISAGAPYLHEDGDTKFGTLTSYGAPHEACQGDVLMGRNGYWLGAEVYNSPQTRSKHSFITDSCVTCHMELTEIDPALGEEGQTRHDFKATPEVCNKCHTAYSAESLQAAFDGKLIQLKKAVGQSILALKYNGVANIPAGTSAVLVANRSGMVDVTTTAGTKRWFIGSKTGQDAFLTDPNTNALVQGCVASTATPGTYDCDGFLKAAPGVTTITDPAKDATVTATGINGVIAKALWNTVLVQDDASRGVHNPSFTFQVIDNTISHVTTFTK